MANEQYLSELTGLVADLCEDEAIALARRLLGSGADPMQVLEECQAGMVEVGERYSRKHYYISGLIMAGEIMTQVGEILEPYIRAAHTGDEQGRVLLGTVAGDIHYIGKNILKLLLRCYGFTVIDLGEDVPASLFVERALQERPGIICLSCLLSSAIGSMRDVIGQLRDRIADLPNPPCTVIGGLVDQKVCDHVGADYWARDAMDGVRICQKVLESKLQVIK